MVNYLGVDLSLAKSGVCVISVKDRKPTVELAYLITSDKEAPIHERIDGTVTELKYLATKVSAEVVAKEASVVGRASTATNVIKTHGVYEHVLADRFSLEDVHNASIKAWARTVTGSDGKRKDKEMVAEAVLAYYGNGIRDKIYTPRGKLIDDVADAIALMTLWLEKEGVIPVKYEKKTKKEGAVK